MGWFNWRNQFRFYLSGLYHCDYYYFVTLFISVPSGSSYVFGDVSGRGWRCIICNAHDAKQRRNYYRLQVCSRLVLRFHAWGITKPRSIAAAFATVWDVSNSSLEEGNFSGMWKLTLLCGCIQLIPLLLLRLLPKDVDEQVGNYRQFWCTFCYYFLTNLFCT